MSKPLYFETQGGGAECFTNNECPVLAMFLLHLSRAPYTNVYDQRLAQLLRRYPYLLHENRRGDNATLTCKGTNCPVYSLERNFKQPVVRVFHLKPKIHLAHL